MMTEEVFYKETVVLYLNYNSAEMVINSVKELRKNYLGDIIIVDNASAQEDKKNLEVLSGTEGIRILYNTENGGYAKGNNFGVRWIAKNMQYKKYVVIVNPDIIVFDDILRKMYKVMEKKRNIAVLSSLILFNGSDRGLQDFGWRLPDRVTLIFGDTHIGKRLHINVNRLYDRINHSRVIQYVDVVPGCFFMARIESFINVGLFDERTFLYYEEHILAEKIKKKGLKEAIFLDGQVNHEHAAKDQGLIDMDKHYIDRKTHIISKEVYIKYFCGLSKLVKVMALGMGRIDILLRKMILIGCKMLNINVSCR